MDEILENFISALRSAGVRVSSSETIDAYRILNLIGYDRKETLRHALAAALAKSAPEKDLFDSCFDLFFSFDWMPISTAVENSGHERALSDRPLLASMLLEGRTADLSAMMVEAAQRMQLNGIQLPTQRGGYAQRLLEMMGIRDAEAYLRQLQADGSSGAQGEAEALEHGIRQLTENVENFVQKQYDLYSGQKTRELVEERIMNSQLYALDERDFEKLNEVVKKIAKRLNDVHSRRKKRAKRGQLDFKRTLRENIHYQELIFNPKWKMKKVDRPDVMVLCDVSRSMAWVVRFFLLLLYSLNKEIARVRTFIFCSDLKEVTASFDRLPAEEAIDRVINGLELNVFMALTDYGEALKDFQKIAFDDVTRKTTVIILGDARSNFSNPRIEIFKMLSDRCKRLVWVNPESPYLWGSGDSVMHRYAPFCHLVRECSTLRHLEQLISPLLQTRR